MNQLRVILAQFRDLYLKMTGAQRLSIALFAGAVFILLTVFTLRATTPGQDKVLFWSVEPAKAKEITDKLNELGRKSQYRNGAIIVEPSADTDELMMALAQGGLLPEDLSYDFKRLVEDNTGFMLTKGERDQRFDIALQTELAKILRKMDFLSDARVNLAPEEESPLLKRHISRTASVVVTVKGKRSLKRSEVEGIARLVASAVKGLTPDKVSISDSMGRPYNYSSEFNANDKFELQAKLEEEYKRKIEDQLLTYIPKVAATVSVSLDLTKRKKEIKDYNHVDLNKGALGVLTHTEQEKETSTSREGSQGVTGAGTNTSGEVKEGDGGTKSDMSKSHKDESFDNSVGQEIIEGDQGTATVKGISVTVVDKKYNDKFDAGRNRGEDNLEYVQHNWMKDEVAAGNPPIESMIASILGVEPAIVKVTQQSMMLDTTPMKPGDVCEVEIEGIGILRKKMAVAKSEFQRPVRPT